MAKQMGIFPMKGNIDNITFFKTKDGFQARKKGGVDREKILHDPKYIRTREHMAEFGKAVKGATLIKQALLKAIIGSIDGRSTNRLSALLINITRKDAVNPRGERSFVQPSLAELTGFDFNSASTMATVLKVKLTSTIDLVTGECKVSIPAYVAEDQISFSADATHYRFRLVAAAVNFTSGDFDMQTAVSAYLPMGTLSETASQELTVTLAPNSTHPVLMALTIEFAQETAVGTMYPLKNGALNPCRIEAVSVGG